MSAASPTKKAPSAQKAPLAQKASARERLLAAADELFYAEGIHTVGIDRVIERAGVAKASLYSTFGSKDELVRANLLGIFDYLGESYRQPTFRGCPFVNANAESQPGGPAEEVTDLSRAWVRSLVRGLVVDLGVPDPDPLVDQLV